MSVQSQQNPQATVAFHLNALQNLHPSLAEPHNSALNYTLSVLDNPQVDNAVCNQAGKVVLIVAKFQQDVRNEITIRGSHSPLSWNEDFPANPQPQEANLFERTFTLHIPTTHMNDALEFKLCLHPETVQKTISWSTGNNWIMELSQYGHIAKLDISDISFS